MFLALALQAALIAMTSVVAMVWQGGGVAGAVLFGGVVALANTGLMVLRWWRGLRDFHCDGERHLRSFHRSSLERFFVVVVLLATGLALLKLAPLPMMLGFIVGQLAWVIAAAVQNTE